MKGLLIKDIRLMKNMRTSLLLILFIAAGMGTYTQDPTFIIIYLAIIGSTFTNSTLSYDEFDNGFSFLFSLPVTKKSYVMEKYCFGLLMCGGGWLAGSVIAGVFGVIRNTVSISDSVMTAFMMLPMSMILLSVLLPFHLKFGGEKGRIVLICAMGLFFLLSFLATKLLKLLPIDLNDLDAALGGLSTMSMGITALISIGIAVVILLVSCSISIGIMEKKEF